jgi:hypothetical protein
MKLNKSVLIPPKAILPMNFWKGSNSTEKIVRGRTALVALLIYSPALILHISNKLEANSLSLGEDETLKIKSFS